MKVTLLYYDIIFEEEPQISIFNNINKEIDIKDKINDFITLDNPEDMFYKNDNYLIWIKEIKPEFIFGTYGRIEDLHNKKLTKVRSKESLEEKDKIKDYIEKYTVFYYDVKNKSCITLHNHHVSGFKKQFSKFLMHHFKLSSIYRNISVLSKIDNNIPQKVNQLEKITKVNYKYSSDCLPENNFLTIKEIDVFSKEQIRSANVELYLEVDSNFDESLELLSETKEYIDKFDTFKIHTDDIVLDVVDKVLSKKIDITVEEEQLEDLSYLKEILIQNLDNY